MLCAELRTGLGQALRNLRSAEVNFENGIYEEACFESHQAAEKALLNSLGVEWRGHSLVLLGREASGKGVGIPGDVAECLLLLNRRFIPSCYPSAFPRGCSGRLLHEERWQACLRCARRVVE